MSAGSDVTFLLTRAASGNRQAANELMQIVYDELRRLASGFLSNERPNHTLQPTALVHEAFLRLVDVPRITELDGAHFRAIAAETMRRVLVDHARAHRAQKRGGDVKKITLDEPVAEGGEPAVDVLAIEEALTNLAAVDPHLARVVELRFFGGLTVDEVAAVLERSKRAIEEDWSLARAWLKRELSR